MGAAIDHLARRGHPVRDRGFGDGIHGHRCGRADSLHPRISCLYVGGAPDDKGPKCGPSSMTKDSSLKGKTSRQSFLRYSLIPAVELFKSGRDVF